MGRTFGLNPRCGYTVPVSERLTTTQQLVRQYLLGQTEGLGASQVAAFILGWSSALELMQRTDLIMPDASSDVRQAVSKAIDELNRAQQTALADS